MFPGGQGMVFFALNEMEKTLMSSSNAVASVRSWLFHFFFHSLAIAALVSTSTPVAAGPNPADRIQLHRNSNRGVPYIKLSQAGQASSAATITMRAVRQIELDGDPLLNVRGNVYPIDVDGDGDYGFVHFNGFRYMRIYGGGGKKLWQIENPGGRVHRDAMHRDTLAVLDADGDGDQDLVHCWVEGGKKVLLVRRGETGAVLRRAVLDGSPSDECQIAAFRVTGRGTPLILVSARNKSGCGTAGNYIDTWGRTLAFDVNLNEVWDRNTCAAGHYVYPVDENADGVAERIFIGKHLYEPNGSRVCTADIGNTHADGVAVADLDPGRSGLEAVLTGANGVKAVSVARNCAAIWAVPTGTIRNPQHIALAKLDPATAIPSIVVHQRGTEPDPTIYFLNGRGQVQAKYAKSKINTEMPYQNANLDGATGSDELMIFFGRVLDRSGKIRLGTDWYWNLKGSKVKLIAPPTGFDRWAPYPIVMDLDHDGRDEIVTWGQSLIVVGRSS